MKQEGLPLYRRVDLHFVWLGLPIAIVIGAGAWLGVPGAILPIFLLALALIACIVYVWVMLPIKNVIGKSALSVLVVCAFGVIGWFFWFVFAVDMKIQLLDGAASPSGGEEVTIAAVLTNRGKPTSLTHWRATLTNPDGSQFIGEPLYLPGDSVQIEDAGHQISYYAVPDCDLRFETTRALQTGDSVYGIAAFLFRNDPAGKLPPGTKIRIEAIDMLGRTIAGQDFVLSAINAQERDVFACRQVRPASAVSSLH